MKVLIVLLLLVFAGCTQAQTSSHQFFVDINDTGSDIDNIKSCMAAGQVWCENYNATHTDSQMICSSIRLSAIGVVCEDGRCIC